MVGVRRLGEKNSFVEERRVVINGLTDKCYYLKT